MPGLVIAAIAVLLLITAAVTWQHRRRPERGEVTLGTEDAVEFIVSRIDAEVFERLGRTGLRRIVEWEIFYLQGLAQEDRRHPVDSIAGDYQPAVIYIVSQIATRHGATYAASDVGKVLEKLVGYMASIGAIGQIAEGDSL